MAVNLLESTTLQDYAKAAGNVLIRKLKSDFIAYVVGLIPLGIAGPFAPVIAVMFGWVFDWIEKQVVFMAFCKYTDFRVAHQGTDLGHAIYLEIQAKKGGDINAIKEAEKNTDKLFDDFVIISH